MADGVVASKTGTTISDNAQTPPRIAPWLFRTRAGWLTLWAATAFVLISSILAYEVFGPGGLLTGSMRWYVLAASTTIWLPLLLLLLDPLESLAAGPRLLLPTICSIVLAAMTVVAIVDHYGGHTLLASAAQKAAFFIFLSLAFIPRIWNAANFARHKARNHAAAQQAARLSALADATANRTATIDVDRELREYRNAESLGALLATVVVIAVSSGALWVGSFQSDPKLGVMLGVAIFVTVIGIFATIVFLDWISRFRPLRMLARTLHGAAPRLHFLTAFYDLVDTGLVRIGGHIAGADHIKTRSRYSILGVTLVCLAALGWFLEPPFGLIPVAFGLVVALSLSRLWSWVEEDRNIASLTQFSPQAPQKIGFREDFRDETLLGFIFVLVLIPIGIMQAHEGQILGGPLFHYSGDPTRLVDGADFTLWLGYFGFELAKALPIVDWADIYHLGPGNDSIEPIRPLGMHAVFSARVIVDLILIAALLQAIGIASRNRQQKSMYAIGRIDRLDELVEKASLNKAIRESRVAGPANFDLFKLGDPDLVDFRRYNEKRLRELRAASAADSELRLFIDQIFAQRGLTAEPAIVAAQNIAASHRNEIELFRMFEQALREHDSRIHTLQLEEIQAVLFELRTTSGMKEFKNELINTAMRKLGSSPEALLDMLTTVAVGSKEERDLFRYTAKMCAEAIEIIAPKLRDTQAVADALLQFEMNGPEAFGAAVTSYQSVLKALREQLDRLRS